MHEEFKNEAWSVSEERDFYRKTLKTISFHKPLERIGLPTTTLLFVSRLGDPPVRQYFEESSRHFKTYNLYTDSSEIFASPFASKISTRTPYIVLSFLELVTRFKFLSGIVSRMLTASQKSHLNYRNSLRRLGPEEMAGQIADLYQTIGLTSFTKLNVIISSRENNDVVFGVKYLCKMLDDEMVRKFLANKNVQIPENYQTAHGILDLHNNTLKYSFVGGVREVNKTLLKFLEKKTHWVMDKINQRGFVKESTSHGKKVLIIGRRILTRGQDVLNENSLIQSYDYQFDIDQKHLRRLLISVLKSFAKSHVKALIIIENFPAQVSLLISQDEELRSLLHGNDMALACVVPETKEIHALKGDQFILKTFH